MATDFLKFIDVHHTKVLKVFKLAIHLDFVKKIVSTYEEN